MAFFRSPEERNSRAEMKVDATEQKRIVRRRIAFGSRRVSHGPDIADPELQSAHDLVSAGDKVEIAVRKRKLRLAIIALAHGNTDDLAPMFGERSRCRALHLNACQGLRYVLADRLLPIGTSRRVCTEDVVAALGMVELNEGGAAIARMKLHAVIGRMIDYIGDTHPIRFGMTGAFVGIVAAADRHASTAAFGLFDETARRDACSNWRNHFEENGFYRQQRVFEAIFGDIT